MSIDLAAIKQRHRNAVNNPRTFGSAGVYPLVMTDMPELMAEVERLTLELKRREALIKWLASIQPVCEDTCVFCGPDVRSIEEPSSTTHEADCLWLRAKTLSDGWPD